MKRVLAKNVRQAEGVATVAEVAENDAAAAVAVIVIDDKF